MTQTKTQTFPARLSNRFSSLLSSIASKFIALKEFSYGNARVLSENIKFSIKFLRKIYTELIIVRKFHYELVDDDA